MASSGNGEYREIYLGMDSDLDSGSDSDDPDYEEETCPESETDQIGESCVSELSESDSEAPREDLDVSQSSATDFEGFADTGLVDVPHGSRETSDDFMKHWVAGGRRQERLPFTAHVGKRRYLDLSEEGYLQYLECFLVEADYKEMATETNRYAEDALSSRRLSAGSRLHAWVPTVWQEMKVFVALTIAMGLMILSDLNEYWTTSDVTSAPFFGNVMTRDRFWLLMTFFHLSDNRLYLDPTSINYNPLQKLGSVYKNVIHKFGSVYHPHQQLSIDEGMVPWRGNLRFKTYNPDKPKKYGMKAYMLCDATNGYICKFQLYTGKTNNKPSEAGIIFDLVMDLLKEYYGKGHHVFMDNYYTSPRLFVNLAAVGISATGTCRVNRKGLPAKLKETKLAKGKICVMHNKSLLACKYSDRKIVYLLSTAETAVITPTGKKNRATGELLKKPSIVIQYDKYMGGVDRADQMLNYTPFPGKTMKWWKRLFFHLVNMAVMNAYLLYKSLTDNPVTARRFRRDLVKELVSSVNLDELPARRKASRGRPGTQDQPVCRLEGRHFPEKIIATGRKKNVSRACIVCTAVGKQRMKDQERPSKKKIRYGRESTYECRVCEAALCVAPCFRLYHTKSDFVAAYIDEEKNK